MNVMFEPVLAIAMIITMARIAIAEGLSGIVWGAIAIVAALGCMYLLPLQFGRVLVAGVLTFALMTGYKVIANK
jgi:hypothetical protein